MELVLAFDVGGTHSRARIAAVTAGGEPTLAAPDTSTRLASARELTAFVSDVAAAAAGLGTVRAAFIAIAGPVTDGRSHVSNWPADSDVSLADLVAAGLPEGRTHMLNDAAVGAWGALARVSGADPAAAAHPLTRSAAGALGPGNLVYVAPGTGLSSATVVRHGLGPAGATVLASEFENTQMPRFAVDVELVAEAIAEKLGREPDWEDLVSGRGLVNIFDALGGRTHAASPPEEDMRTAEAVAAAARAGSDPRARAASDLFYRTLGLFAQTLALTCLPCAAVVIGGASTERNLEIVRDGGLADTFAAHHRFATLLGAIPLYTVGGDVNLEGAVRLALLDL